MIQAALLPDSTPEPAPAAATACWQEERGRRLDAFLRGVEKRAFRMARYATGDDEAALDRVQEAMLAFVRRYAGHPEDQWPPLFHTVLESKLRDHRRRERVRGRLFAFSFGRRDPEDQEDPIAQAADLDDPGPLTLLAAAELREGLDRALTTLSDRQRQAFLYRFGEGYDVATTAQVMGCSEGSVKTHLFRALQGLRQQLEAFR